MTAHQLIVALDDGRDLPAAVTTVRGITTIRCGRTTPRPERAAPRRRVNPHLLGLIATIAANAMPYR